MWQRDVANWECEVTTPLRDLHPRQREADAGSCEVAKLGCDVAARQREVAPSFCEVAQRFCDLKQSLRDVILPSPAVETAEKGAFAVCKQFLWKLKINGWRRGAGSNSPPIMKKILIIIGVIILFPIGCSVVFFVTMRSANKARYAPENQLAVATKQLAAATTDMDQVYALQRMIRLNLELAKTEEAKRLATELITHGEKLQGDQRFFALNQMAKQSFFLGRTEGARKYATELLQLAVTLAPKFRPNQKQKAYPLNYGICGNAIHDGNVVLGRIAVREGRIEDAKQNLLAAGSTGGSPNLGSFGPNMSLAKELLEKGEHETVLQYFQLCEKFWRMPEATGAQSGAKLTAWTTAVKARKIPEFGDHLLY